MRPPKIIVHPETGEEMTVEQAAKLIGLSSSGMRRRLLCPKWTVEKALLQQPGWKRTKDSRTRPKPVVTTIKVPKALLPQGKSPNSAIKRAIRRVNSLKISTHPKGETKLIRLALTHSEKEKLDNLIKSAAIAEGKKVSMTQAVIALLYESAIADLLEEKNL